MDKIREKTGPKPIILSLIITVVFGVIYFYFALPPINPQSTDFWFFIFLLLVVYMVAVLLLSGVKVGRENLREVPHELGQRCKVPLVLLAMVVLVLLIGNLVSAKIFHATDYYQLLDVQEGDFIEDVAEISYDKIPMLDKDSSVQLGSRALGSISTTDSDLVSQFEVSSLEYSQINYDNEPVRVAPLKYGSIIKWLINRSDGLPGYILVNMVTQEARLVQLDEGMKYSTAEHFGRNLSRTLRFHYPTKIFGDVDFEIDDDGTPWWVCSYVVKKIGLFGGTDVDGAVLVNAITGECMDYACDEVPTWVDRVYSADLLVEQYNYHGTLVNGWINSWLGQKGITNTTSGYNYIALNDDVYLYTGITSVGGDDSNVGFILINQRTKEAKFYNITGATEYSAMSSAEGLAQEYSYSATFPLLLNISNQPTYFIALKDSSQLVKMYAMVNVTDYNIAARGNTVAECQANYEVKLEQNGIEVHDPLLDEEISAADTADTENADETKTDTAGTADETGAESTDEAETAELLTVSGTITDIRSAVVDGNTIYYLSLGEDVYYAVSAADCPQAVLYNVGDKVTITYEAAEGELLSAADAIRS